MNQPRIEDLIRFDNGTIGKDHYIEQGAEIGLRYHQKAGRAHIGERSFNAVGAVINRDVPLRSFVKGVPGEISDLPESFNMPNSRDLTRSPYSFREPGLDYQGSDL